MRLRAIMATATMAGLADPARAATHVHGPASADLLWALVTALCVLLTGGVLFAALRLALGVRAGTDVEATRGDTRTRGNGGLSK